MGPKAKFVVSIFGILCAANVVTGYLTVREVEGAAKKKSAVKTRLKKRAA